MGSESSQCATEGHIDGCERLLLLFIDLETVAAAAAANARELAITEHFTIASNVTHPPEKLCVRLQRHP